MSGFQSAMFKPVQWNAINRKAKALMKKIGAVTQPDFFSSGMPQISFTDMTVPNDTKFDFTPFKGRIIIGKNSGFNSTDISPFPHGPVRLTVLRWGTGENQCGRIVVGDGSGLNGTSIVSYASVTIGNGVLFGPEVIIMDSDGHPADRRLEDNIQNKKVAPVVIGDQCWIGHGALIMKGVTIGHHAVVAAYSVVTKSVPPHGVVAGNPARLIHEFK